MKIPGIAPIVTAEPARGSMKEFIAAYGVTSVLLFVVIFLVI